MLHEHEDTTTSNTQQGSKTVDSQFLSSQFEDEFKILGYPITTIVQYIFNVDLALNILCALSLIVCMRHLTIVQPC